MDAVVAPQPVGAHPLRCGERVLGVGTEWREVLESDILLHDGSSCEGAATDWLPTRDVTKQILAVDGERVAKVAIRYPADAVLGGRTVVVDDDGNATEESPPTGDDGSFLRRNVNSILIDAAIGTLYDPAILPSGQLAWPLPRVQKLSAAFDVPFPVVMRAFGLDGRGAGGEGRLTLRYRGIVERTFGRTRAFVGQVETHVGSAGLCHSFDASLRLRGSLWFAEHEDVLVEADLAGDPVWTHSLCMTCGKGGQERCPPRVCAREHATLKFRILCNQ